LDTIARRIRLIVFSQRNKTPNMEGERAEEGFVHPDNSSKFPFHNAVEKALQLPKSSSSVSLESPRPQQSVASTQTSCGQFAPAGSTIHTNNPKSIHVHREEGLPNVFQQSHMHDHIHTTAECITIYGSTGVHQPQSDTIGLAPTSVANRDSIASVPSISHSHVEVARAHADLALQHGQDNNGTCFERFVRRHLNKSYHVLHIFLDDLLHNLPWVRVFRVLFLCIVAFAFGAMPTLFWTRRIDYALYAGLFIEGIASFGILVGAYVLNECRMTLQEQQRQQQQQRGAGNQPSNQNSRVGISNSVVHTNPLKAQTHAHAMSMINNPANNSSNYSLDISSSSAFSSLSSSPPAAPRSSFSYHSSVNGTVSETSEQNFGGSTSVTTTTVVHISQSESTTGPSAFDSNSVTNFVTNRHASSLVSNANFYNQSQQIWQ
jgi:hypothetical protein